MVANVSKLTLRDFPEMERINAEFEDFSKYVGQEVVILEGHIETVQDKDSKTFESAVMWVQLVKDDSYHLVRSSGYRVRQILKLALDKDMIPLHCKFALVDKSHMLVEPDEIPF